MRNYLTELKENPAYEAANALVPEGLCPFLFYNLTPYVHTLSRGGWFGWVKRHKNPLYRKASGGMDFGKSRVNRLFPNEVLVRCPNPRAMVVAGVGPWTDGKMKIRILRSHEACANNHRNEEEFILDARNAEEKALSVNALFPEALGVSVTGKTPWEQHNGCNIYRTLNVEAAEIISPCRYHPSASLPSALLPSALLPSTSLPSTSLGTGGTGGKKDEKKGLGLIPGDFCPHVFARIYPRVLAMMYEKDRRAETSEKLEIVHPGTDKKVTLSLKKIFRDALRAGKPRPYGKKLLRNIFKKVCEVMSLPVDFLDYNLEIEVLQTGADKCSLKEGKKYTVNLRSKDFLCPAAFHAIYPYLLLASTGHGVKWSSEEATALSPCPDCAGTVYFIGERGKHREENNQDTRYNNQTRNNNQNSITKQEEKW